MKKVMRDIQRCINRFQFALLIYYDSENHLRLHEIFAVLEELLKNDLLRTFKRHWVAGSEK